MEWGRKYIKGVFALVAILAAIKLCLKVTRLMSDDLEAIEAPEEPGETEEAVNAPFEGQDGASVPGVPFAYELTRDEIIRQEASIREVNSRLGFLLAAALTFATFFYRDVTDPLLRLLGGIALIVVLILLLLGYVPRTHVRAPNPNAIVEDAGNRPGRMKENALGSMLAAFNLNLGVIQKKNQYYGLALVLGVSLVIFGLGVEAFEGGHSLWSEWKASSTARPNALTSGGPKSLTVPVQSRPARGTKSAPRTIASHRPH